MFNLFSWFKKKKKLNVYLIVYYAFATQKSVTSVIYTDEKIQKKKNLDLSNGYFEQVKILIVYEE